MVLSFSLHRSAGFRYEEFNTRAQALSSEQKKKKILGAQRHRNAHNIPDLNDAVNG